MFDIAIRKSVPHSRTVLAAKKPTSSAPKATEPQNIEDVIAEHQHAVDRFDARLKQLADPQWLADRKSKLEKQRSTAQHEVDILRQVAPPAKAG